MIFSFSWFSFANLATHFPVCNSADDYHSIGHHCNLDYCANSKVELEYSSNPDFLY